MSLPLRPTSPRLIQRLDQWDLKLYGKAAKAHSPVLDAVLPKLTSSANHGLLWLGVAAGAAALGGRKQRRAALRGLLSLGVASAITNVPAKFAARRTRPDIRLVPLIRHLPRQPRTSSFPSGHSASAAAFTIGASMEQPLLIAPLALLAAGVAYGRIHTGVHYPGDVVAGLAIGASAAYAVHRAWPAPPTQAWVQQARAEAPALPGGQGLAIVLNKAAGGGDGVDELAEQLATLLPEAKIVLAEPDELDSALKEAAADSIALGVSGGDGTLNTAATIALDAGLPLVVLPGGTLNHFAGDVGLGDVEAIASAVEAGDAVDLHIGSSTADGDGGYFLNTLALGIYPELVRKREKLEHRIGKWPAMIWSTARLLPGAKPIVVEVAGERRVLWTLFAGNGQYHPQGFAPSWRNRLDEGTVDVRLIDAETRFARTHLVFAVLSGRLARSRAYEQRLVAELDVKVVADSLTLARDGEVGDSPSRMRLRAASKTLTVYRPA